MTQGLPIETHGTGPKHRRRAVALCLIAIATAVVAAQVQPVDERQRVEERIRALQRESDALARQSRTLLGELRQLEIERDLQAEEARRAEAESAEAQQALQQATTRLAELEQRRAAQLPDLQAQLVDLYKRGRSRYVELLFSAGSAREFARTMRAVAALATIHERRLEDHRRTLDELAAERTALERTAATLRDRDAAARSARAAAQRAVDARTALLARIDSRRDLTAQLAGELQVVSDRLEQAAANARTGTVAVPLTPFRGSLQWPVSGRIASRFGQDAGRLGGTAVQNGIEITAAEGTPVVAVHGGTVGHAAVFTGFGNLVIVDHGSNNYSLYGYLRDMAVERGAVVDAGTELGRVGPSPAGPPALYFELRIDGRSVDPLQWLEGR
jgi:septal ring factor EnvC (AmiA/AmiB activator)